MKVIIAGSRNIVGTDEDMDRIVASSGFQVTELVSGGANGIDKLGEEWARSRGIPITRFEPDWKNLGKGAGIVRNKQMVDYADALIAVWDGSSRGTKSTIDYAEKKGIPFLIRSVERTEADDAGEEVKL